MIKPAIDQEALVSMFSQASARHGETLRKAVSDATLRALQGRELTLQNIKSVLKTVTQAASAGAASNPAANVDVEAMLTNALAGMDAALLKAVEANRTALQQFVDQGVDLHEARLKNALTDLEKMEDSFVAAVKQASKSASEPLRGHWAHALDAFQVQGTETGAQATEAVRQLMTQTQSALRESRAMALKGALALADSYSAVVSGVLIGMSQGMQRGSPAAAQAAEEAGEDGTAPARGAKPRAARKTG